MISALRAFMPRRFALFFFLCWFACTAMAQQASAPQSGSIYGTVMDAQDNVIPGASVILDGGTPAERKTTTSQTGFFSFNAVQPGVVHHLAIHAQGFADWTSPPILIAPGQFRDLSSIRLTISVAATTVVAVVPPDVIATREVHREETQRALGVLPEFFAVYTPHPAPLTPRLKFSLAWHTAADPVTILAAGFVAGMDQASDTPAYVEGARGYGERLGANYADNLSDIFLAGAVLPIVFHQDPRYYYKGTGSVESRVFHALRNPFVCKGDNGHWQPNFSSMGGYLASGALANTYYPQASRGASLVFSTAAVDAGGDMVSSLIQEFIVHRKRKKK